jgi:NADH-quinone oxidoreductase subunit M
VGLTQKDLKYVIGYSSVSHMGIVGLGLSTVTVGGLNGAVYQMFAHGIMTALFFSSVGYIYDKTHTKMIPELGGLSRVIPVAAFYFILAALTAIGVPGLAAFWGELAVFISCFKVYPILAVLSICGLAITALFMLRVVQQTCYGSPKEHHAHIQDLSFAMGIPRMILSVVIVFFGLFPSFMFDMIETASSSFFKGLP